MEHLLEELKPPVYYSFKLFGLDLSITKAVVALWVAALIVFLLIWLPSRRLKLDGGGRFQGLVESLIEFAQNSLIGEIMGETGKPYFPFVATLFLFIFITNLVGLIPGFFAATSLIGTTAGWAVIVFILYNLAGVMQHGLFGYIKHFFPQVPVFLYPIIIPLEIVSHIARPISLAIRLFANVVAGHMVLLVFTFIAVTSVWFLKPLPFVMIVIMNLFEIFVAAIQAYIFAVLAAIYISQAVATEH